MSSKDRKGAANAGVTMDPQDPWSVEVPSRIMDLTAECSVRCLRNGSARESLPFGFEQANMVHFVTGCLDIWQHEMAGSD